MVGKNIIFSNDARKRMLDGMIRLEKAVLTTLGPKGKCVLIDKNNTIPFITKDGVSVAKEVAFTDVYKNIGAQIAKDVARRTNTVAGDGTTTSTLLVVEMCKTGTELISLGFDANDIGKGMKLAKDDILNELEKVKKVISSEDEIRSVATISANNDSEIGSVICEAFTNIGDSGIVTLMNATNKHGKTSIDYSSGLEFPNGFTSSVFINSNDETVEFENPLILLAEKLPDDYDELINVINYANSENRPLVIISSFFSDVMSSKIYQAASNGFDIVSITAPGMNKDTIHNNLEDLSVMLNAKILGDKGFTIDKFLPSRDLGQAESIKSYKKKTVITGAKTNEEELNKHVEKLKHALSKQDTDESLTEYEAGALKERIAKLTGGVACIKVGAFSQIELEEKMARYEDGTCAVRAALSDGIVPGGGTALLKISHILRKRLNKKKFENDVVKRGYEAMLDIIRMPAKTIISSVSKDSELLMSKIEKNKNFNFGFNAKTEKLTNDLLKDGVIDPVKVTKTALIYSTSNATTFLTTDCVITLDLPNTRMDANDEVMIYNDEE